MSNFLLRPGEEDFLGCENSPGKDFETDHLDGRRNEKQVENFFVNDIETIFLVILDIFWDIFGKDFETDHFDGN